MIYTLIAYSEDYTDPNGRRVPSNYCWTTTTSLSEIIKDWVEILRKPAKYTIDLLINGKFVYSNLVGQNMVVLTQENDAADGRIEYKDQVKSILLAVEHDYQLAEHIAKEEQWFEDHSGR